MFGHGVDVVVLKSPTSILFDILSSQSLAFGVSVWGGPGCDDDDDIAGSFRL